MEDSVFEFLPVPGGALRLPLPRGHVRKSLYNLVLELLAGFTLPLHVAKEYTAHASKSGPLLVQGELFAYLSLGRLDPADKAGERGVFPVERELRDGVVDALLESVADLTVAFFQFGD